MMLFDVLIGKVILLLQDCFFSDCLQIRQLLEIVVFTLQCSRFRIEFCRIQIQVVQILSPIFSVTPRIQTLKLFLIRLGWESGSQQWIIVPLTLVLFSFDFFAHFLILLEIIDDFTVHLRSISVPAIPFYLPCISNFFDKIIGSNAFIGKASSNFTRTLSALFLIMSHGSTILAGSFTIVGRLVPLLSSLIPLFDEAFRFIDWDFNEFSSTFGVLGVPRQLFNILRCILLFLHLLYYINREHILSKMDNKTYFSTIPYEQDSYWRLNRDVTSKVDLKNKQG